MMSVERRQEQRSIINGSKPSGIKIRAIACGWYLALIIYHNSILNNIFHYMTWILLLIYKCIFKKKMSSCTVSVEIHKRISCDKLWQRHSTLHWSWSQQISLSQHILAANCTFSTNPCTTDCSQIYRFPLKCTQQMAHWLQLTCPCGHISNGCC